MSQENRVFITGLSALTASGLTAEANWQAILSKQSGIDEIKQWDISTWPNRLGGELKGFEPSRMLPDRKLVKVISKQDGFGINAAMQAVMHSEMIPYRDSLATSEEFNNKTAVFVGSPGNKYCQQYDFLPLVAKAQDNFKTFADELFNEVHPMWLLRILPNNVLAYTGITYGFKGPNHNISNHAVSGMQALIEAFHTIRSGHAERAVVVAYDLSIEPQGMFYYDKLGVLSNTTLSPFDAQHNGTILGEGAAAIVLESEASVNERGAKTYAEVLGGQSATEASGLFSLQEDGAPLQTLMQSTLSALSLSTNQIDMVVAHGNGNVKSDASEAKAITRLLNDVPVTAFKWSMGHTLSASGLLDAVLATYALKENCLPGIGNFQTLAHECQGLNVNADNRLLSSASMAMIINRGFGGMNACLVMKACD